MASVEMPVITNQYGRTTSVNVGPHRGLDLRSALNAPVLSIFDGTVVRARKRLKGAPIGRNDANGTPALLGDVSGGGTVVQLADGTFYSEVHMSPSVKVGDKVRAFETVLGHTDESGTIYGTHRHVQMNVSLVNGTHFNPTSLVRAAFRAGPREDELDVNEATLRKIIREEIKANAGYAVLSYRNKKTDLGKQGDVYKALQNIVILLQRIVKKVGA